MAKNSDFGSRQRRRSTQRRPSAAIIIPQEITGLPLEEMDTAEAIRHNKELWNKVLDMSPEIEAHTIRDIEARKRGDKPESQDPRLRFMGKFMEELIQERIERRKTLQDTVPSGISPTAKTSKYDR